MKNPKYSGGTTVTQGMLPAPPPLLQLSLRQANLPVLELRPSPGPWSANGTKVDPIPNPPPKKKTRGTVLFFGVWEIWKFSGLTRLVCKFDSLNVPRILGASEFLQGFCFLALKKPMGFLWVQMIHPRDPRFSDLFVVGGQGLVSFTEQQNDLRPGNDVRFDVRTLDTPQR